MGAVQASLARQALEQVRIVDQRLAQPGAVAEHDDRVVNQERVLFEQTEKIGRRRFSQPLELVHRRIRVGRAQQ